MLASNNILCAALSALLRVSQVSDSKTCCPRSMHIPQPLTAQLLTPHAPPPQPCVSIHRCPARARALHFLPLHLSACRRRVASVCLCELALGICCLLPGDRFSNQPLLPWSPFSAIIVNSRTLALFRLPSVSSEKSFCQARANSSCAPGGGRAASAAPAAARALCPSK